jgi:mitochondrial fission protein ELM1
MPKKIIILSDNIPGHLNQSEGIAALLKTQFDCSVRLIPVVYNLHFFRSFITFLGRHLCKSITPFKARFINSFYQNIEVNHADLIIAAGGNTAPLAAALRIINSVPLIQLGSPRGLSPDLFNALVTVERYYDHPANIVVDITPNKYSPIICSQASHSQNMQQHLLFLIGGEGIGYSYTQNEWTALVNNICSLQKISGLPITIVTSRRTDPRIEKKLRYELSRLLMIYSAWYHEGSINFNLAPLLGSAHSIFVTEDSAMMISESISSGRPVTTLYPSQIKSPLRYQKHIQKYLDSSFISREPITSFSTKDISDSAEKVQRHSENLKEKLIERIQW